MFIKKLIILILAMAIAGGSAAAGKSDFTGYLAEVIAADGSRRNDVYLKLFSPEDSSACYADDFFLVYLIENTHKVLLSDFAGKAPPERIGLRLEGVSYENREIEGRLERFISGMEKIYPDYPGSEKSYFYKSINPGIPSEDFYHRYIEVPVSYRDPGGETFSLYYELCGDFNQERPTVIIPTDAQRSLSQVGWADRYKEMFDLDFNTVTYEYRGMYASGIPAVADPGLDWNRAYRILNSDNAVEDIERIRRDLPGDGRVYILGGSGTAMIGLKYIAAYPEKVARAFLMSFFKDARGSSEAGIDFFDEFLSENGLEKPYRSIIKDPGIDSRQLLFLIQRLFYYDKDKVKEMIQEISENDYGLFDEYSSSLGGVSYFIRSARKYRPWSVVFMYETNIKTSPDGTPDINYPFYQMAAPVREARSSAPAAEQDFFDIEGLEKVGTEILLVAGTLDQVAPVQELERIHRLLPNSKLAVFEAYHCLQASEESKECRNRLANLFFKHGLDHPALADYLESEENPCEFIRLEE